jgi:hypothetical protein
MGVWRHHGAVASISTREYAGHLVRYLIDDTEGTNWQSSGAPVERRQVLVEFAGQSTFDGAE